MDMFAPQLPTQPAASGFAPPSYTSSSYVPPSQAAPNYAATSQAATGYATTQPPTTAPVPPRQAVQAPAGFAGDIVVLHGSRLLAGVLDPPGLAAHRARWPKPRRQSLNELVAVTNSAHLLGRGGAGFPMSRKLSSTGQSKGKGRRVVVVNAAEGEPGSAKDASLMITSPHVVLDGAASAAMALETTEVHIIVPAERPAVARAVEQAIATSDHDLEFMVSTAGGFVGGQAMAIMELLAGRENLPVTGWVPPSESGLRGRPTLISNAETFAQLAVLLALGAQEYARLGTSTEPGTVLLTVAGDGPHGLVLEVPLGVSLHDVLAYCGHDVGAPLIVGGYHGTWLSPADIATRTVSRNDLAGIGASLGAGVMLPVPRQSCPIALTANVIAYLADQSARRCGPCRNGLPALATVCARLAEGHAGDETFEQLNRLIGLLPGRGACAHPDGSVRLVRSLLRVFPLEVGSHLSGRCRYTAADGGWL